jgi:hypothetical protein
MSTRSIIGVLHNNKCKAVYCHFDGYLRGGVGQTLLLDYDAAKADQLVALGDISSLGAEIGEKHDFDNCPTGVTNFYGRDRGDDAAFRTYDSAVEMVRENDYAEYIYVMHDGVWYVNYCNGNADEWFVLADELANESKQ